MVDVIENNRVKDIGLKSNPKLRFSDSPAIPACRQAGALLQSAAPPYVFTIVGLVGHCGDNYEI